jgi:hypothetical protein
MAFADHPHLESDTTRSNRARDVEAIAYKIKHWRMMRSAQGNRHALRIGLSGHRKDVPCYLSNGNLFKRKVGSP